MINLGDLLSGFNLLFSDLSNWTVVIPGMLIGLTFGAIPGLSVSMAMAIFLPITFYMDFIPAILFMSSMFTGSCFGSSIPAILINIPGMAASVATAFDGYQMTLRGKHNEALGCALGASVVGTFIGYLVLFFAVKPLGLLGMYLGPPEMFMLVFWGLTLIAGLGGSHIIRGLISGLFGILVGTIGFSGQGVIRGTFGIDHMLGGVPPIPAMIGLFASAELFRLMDAGYIVTDEASRKLNFSAILQGVKFSFKNIENIIAILRGGIIGVIIGACPGVGAAVANLVSYNECRRTSKHPETFGHGNPIGVIGAESANSSSEGGSMATMLSLGIPGGGATAVMLGAFALHNITGGPRFMATHMDWVYAIILSNFAQVLILLIIGIFFTYYSAKIVTLPNMIIIPTITVLAFLGAYALTNSLYGPIVMLVFSILGWWMKTYDYSVAAAVVGILLGGMAEGNLLRSYQLGGGDLTILFTRPISGGLALIIFLILFAPVLKTYRKNRTNKKSTHGRNL